MRTELISIFAALTAVLFSFPVLCQDLEKDFKDEIALYRIRPDQVQSLRRDPNGIPLSESRLKQVVQAFYDRLYPLGPSFLKPFKLKSVVFKDTLYDPEGTQTTAEIRGGEFFMDADMTESMFYTTVMFMLETAMSSSYKARWPKFNPDGFIYENKRGSNTKAGQKKLDAVLAEWDKYFVSRMAMYSVEYDIAETFSYMIRKGPDATAFVQENSPDVQKKFDMVIDILESIKSCSPGYMQTLLTPDLSKLKTYSPSALAVRLFREYSGVWSASPAKEENAAEQAPGKAGGQAEKAAAPRKIGDPVTVAGRKIVPLILSLETKDGRLFRLLMENKVDPNVVNDKKVSALMLAISNNDPEQVKALIEAGAKVTPEAARAGAASGVNAEIVQLFKQYLPGGKSQPDKTAKSKSHAQGGNNAQGGAAKRTP